MTDLDSFCSISLDSGCEFNTGLDSCIKVVDLASASWCIVSLRLEIWHCRALLRLMIPLIAVIKVPGICLFSSGGRDGRATTLETANAVTRREPSIVEYDDKTNVVEVESERRWLSVCGGSSFYIPMNLRRRDLSGVKDVFES
jgi:hypothetical protein